MANFVVTTTDGNEVRISDINFSSPESVALEARQTGFIATKMLVGHPGSHQGEVAIAIMASAMVAIREDEG